MNYLFIQAIEECIQNCLDFGSGEVKKGKDNCDCPLVWVSAEWTEYDNEQNVILLYIRDIDTGRIVYSTYIMETLVKK